MLNKDFYSLFHHIYLIDKQMFHFFVFFLPKDWIRMYNFP